MNYLLKKSFFVSPSVSYKSDPNFFDKLNIVPARIFHLLLGISSAAIAFPLITLAIILSVFFSEEKWEKFWDRFLEA